MASAVGAATPFARGDAGSPQLPPGLFVAGEDQRLRINGIDVHGRALNSELGPEEACASLERAWRTDAGRAPPARCERAGRWVLIAHRAGRAMQAAQFEAKGRGSSGFISELDPQALPAARVLPLLPLPVGARVLNVVQSIEAGDAVTGFTLRCPGPPALALQRLQAAARARGWTVAGSNRGAVIDLQRGTAAVRAIATGAGPGSTIVLVEHQSRGSRR